MTKHTPGPWDIDRKGDQTLIYGDSDYDLQNSCLIADICTDNEFVIVPLEERMANAHLIAAAPDLLEALESMVRTCDAGKRPIATRKKARAAIAKARGQS